MQFCFFSAVLSSFFPSSLSLTADLKGKGISASMWHYWESGVCVLNVSSDESKMASYSWIKCMLSHSLHFTACEFLLWNKMINSGNHHNCILICCTGFLHFLLSPFSWCLQFFVVYLFYIHSLYITIPFAMCSGGFVFRSPGADAYDALSKGI